MLEGITKALTDSFKVISGNAKITEANIGSVINEIRVALLDADVDDSVIRRVVVEQWHTSEEELIDLLVDAKIEIALFLLKQHLTFQGYAPEEANKFISSNMIKIHLSRDHELLKSWKNPEKIIKEVQKKKKSKVKG